MNGLEDELRRGLRRKEPPEGFAVRVLWTLDARRSRSGFGQLAAGLFHRPGMRWVLAVGACLVLAITLADRQRQERARAVLASQQAMLALRIASSRINMALQQAQQLTERALAVKSKRRSERL